MQNEKAQSKTPICGGEIVIAPRGAEGAGSSPSKRAPGDPRRSDIEAGSSRAWGERHRVHASSLPAEAARLSALAGRRDRWRSASSVVMKTTGGEAMVTMPFDE